MKRLIILALLLYAFITTYYTFYPMVYDRIHPPATNALDAGGSDEQWAFLQDVARLIDYAYAKGYKLTGGELYRTMYQQRYYVRHGLSWTYKSNHLKRRAIDLNLFINNRLQQRKEAYRDLGMYWETLDPHNRWGGRFNDAQHFERRN